MENIHLSDEVLLRLIARRDACALETLYDRHAQVMYNLILRIVNEPTSAGKVLEDTFWQVWQEAGECRGGGSVGAWLCRIARKKSLDVLRGRPAQPPCLLPDRLQVEEAFRTWLAIMKSSPETMAELQSNPQALRQALDRVPEAQRLVLEQAYFGG